MSEEMKKRRYDVLCEVVMLWSEKRKRSVRMKEVGSEGVVALWNERTRRRWSNGAQDVTIENTLLYVYVLTLLNKTR